MVSEALDITQRQCIIIASDIRTLSMFHKFGSRKLVENISSLGYYILYSKICCLTSISIYVNQIETSSYECFKYQQRKMVGNWSSELENNWDQNEKTIDGKCIMYSNEQV